jgi:hypothetical protein
VGLHFLYDPLLDGRWIIVEKSKKKKQKQKQKKLKNKKKEKIFACCKLYIPLYFFLMYVIELTKQHLLVHPLPPHLKPQHLTSQKVALSYPLRVDKIV